MRVGEYELGKTLGHGSSSKVKVATNVGTGEEFVVKIVAKKGDSIRSSKDVKNEVRMEIAVMKRLQHVNIVQLVEVMESKNHYYIVLESVRGGDLCEKIMKEHKLHEDQAVTYLGNFIEGLRACHAAGVAHRDIKPENCLISKAGQLKVADFGLSRLHKAPSIASTPSCSPEGSEAGDSPCPSPCSSTTTTVHTIPAAEYSTDVVGTLSYAAPEVFEGHYNAYQADLWSIGVMLFVMLTGKFPFGTKGCTQEQVKEDMRRGRINKIPASMSPEARKLIQSLIVVVPSKRLSLDGIMKHPFLTPYFAGKAGLTRPAIDISTVHNGSSISETPSPAWHPRDSPVCQEEAKGSPQGESILLARTEQSVVEAR